MPFLVLSSGQVHFSDEGVGPPVVLLHANPGDSRDFSAVIPTLAKSYRVVCLDWPGYGSSAVPERPDAIDVLYFYRLLLEFIAKLALPPAVFIGNSLGGNAAARLAVEHPKLVRGLILVSPGGFTSPSLVTRSFCKLQGSALSLPPGWFAALYLKRSTPAVKSMLLRARTEQSSPPRVAISRALWRSFGQGENDLRDLSRAISVSTLLVFGKRDPVISARRDGENAARAIAGSRLITLDCGHAPFAEDPAGFLSEVLPFIGECLNATHRADIHGSALDERS
jgi:pimeloyl-ACP methyl ester carboxylesterase